MKLIYIFSLMFVSLIFIGCASSGGSEATSSEDVPAEEGSSSMGAKTAYEGSTGSGLLMERYKSGQIEGFRE
jgi:hypothetical protein